MPVDRETDASPLHNRELHFVFVPDKGGFGSKIQRYQRSAQGFGEIGYGCEISDKQAVVFISIPEPFYEGNAAYTNQVTQFLFVGGFRLVAARLNPEDNYHNSDSRNVILAGIEGQDGLRDMGDLDQIALFARGRDKIIDLRS